jgi:hypothetical protein
MQYDHGDDGQHRSGAEAERSIDQHVDDLSGVTKEEQPCENGYAQQNKDHNLGTQ